MPGVMHAFAWNMTAVEKFSPERLGESASVSRLAAAAAILLTRPS